MIELTVELEDMTDGYKSVTVKLPCNLRAYLEHDHEYVIAETTPDIAIGEYDDIVKLNAVIDEINAENPDMTAEYLDILIQNTSGSLYDKEFVRRVKENDFMFEDISDLKYLMTVEEKAGYYLATVLKIPFDRNVTEKQMAYLCDESLVDYIDWEEIWRKYMVMGFFLADTFSTSDFGDYIMHW